MTPDVVVVLYTFALVRVVFELRSRKTAIVRQSFYVTRVYVTRVDIRRVQTTTDLAASIPCLNPYGEILSYTLWSAPTGTKQGWQVFAT